MLKNIIVALLFSVNIFALEKLMIPIDVNSHNSKELLESISKYAIKIGSGSLNNAYVFVDPMCPFSKRYMKQLLTNKESTKHTTYYIFLYKLPKFESSNLIKYIYQSRNMMQTLSHIMVDNSEEDFSHVEPIDSKIGQTCIQEISDVAAKLNIIVRPYIMEFQEGSPYCLVSSGDAPCLEENNF